MFKALPVIAATRSATHLSPTARHVLIAVAMRAGRDGDREALCWASAATLGADTGLAERTVRRVLDDLAACGALEAERRPGQTTRYRVLGVGTPDTGSGVGASGPRTQDPGSPRTQDPGTPDTVSDDPYLNRPRGSDLPPNPPTGGAFTWIRDELLRDLREAWLEDPEIRPPYWWTAPGRGELAGLRKLLRPRPGCPAKLRGVDLIAALRSAYDLAPRPENRR